MAGSRGPVPNRSDQRRRRNKTDGLGLVSADGAFDVDVPPADEAWHPTARRWYESLASSGQSEFYEPSDWATAYLVTDTMSMALLSGEPIPGASLSAWRAYMATLLVTEGDRRRAAVELTKPAPAEESGDVSLLDEYRRKLESRRSS